TMQPLTLVYPVSSAFFTTSVYHWAKSSSMEVIASTSFFSFAIIALLLTSAAAYCRRNILFMGNGSLLSGAYPAILAERFHFTGKSLPPKQKKRRPLHTDRDQTLSGGATLISSPEI